MQCAHCELEVLLLDDNRNLNFRGRDDLNIYVLIGQGLEHLARDAGVGLHSYADYRNLADLLIYAHRLRF